MIYRIVCNDATIEEQYVGSTTNLSQRRVQHKHSTTNPKNKEYNQTKYVFIREHGGWDAWSLILVEAFAASSSEDARRRERYWIEIYSAKLNKSRPIVSAEEIRENHTVYTAANSERIAAYQTNYAAVNSERLAAYQENYKAANSERIFAVKKIYAAANSERIAAAKKNYRAANIDVIRENDAKYYAANIDAIREKNAAYYQRKKLEKAAAKISA